MGEITSSFNFYAPLMSLPIFWKRGQRRFPFAHTKIGCFA